MSLSPASANVFVSLGKKLSLNCFVDLSASGSIGCGKYYNLSADEVCTWPVAPLSEAKWLWRFSWYRNNRQQRFVSSGKRRYTNADIIINYTCYQICDALPQNREQVTFWVKWVLSVIEESTLSALVWCIIKLILLYLLRYDHVCIRL